MEIPNAGNRFHIVEGSIGPIHKLRHPHILDHLDLVVAV
jgi:hypothetical protein